MEKRVIIGFLVLLLGVFVLSARPQQNTSGGAVTIVGAGNSAAVTSQNALKVDGSAVTQPVSGTFWQATQPVSGNVGITGSLPTGANVIGKVNVAPLDACGGVNYDSGLITLPTSTTALTSTATCVQIIGFNNTTGSQQTVTVTDGQGTPQPVFSSFVIQPNSQVVVRFDGIRFIGGIKWSSVNGSAVVGWVKGDQ